VLSSAAFPDSERGDRVDREGSGRVSLAVRGLHKTYGKDVHALRGIDLEVRQGEFVSVLGPSGSGKTTLLMVVGGFEIPTRGRVYAGDVDVTDVPPERRGFGVVFQSYALFPHMTVRRNVQYPLDARGIAGARRESLIDEVLSLVGLESLDKRRPSQLSGGQQQRVALARALVYGPSLLLLDEPLGALDRELRERMQLELRKLQRKLQTTFLYVTHDQDEALTMSDRIVVMHNGLVEQIDTPQELYARPASEFVAAFLGSPNRLQGQVKEATGAAALIQLSFGAAVAIPCRRNSLTTGARAIVVIRPEHIRIGALEAEAHLGEMRIEGRVELEVFAGIGWRYSVSTPAGEMQVHLGERSAARSGDPVRLFWSASRSWAVPADSEGRSGKEGDLGPRDKLA